MLKRRLPPTLKKIGFTIVSTDRRSIFERIDPVARHPITLTILAFILSGFVGTWLSVRYQREQHEQESMRKNMDEVRLSIDTTNQAYDDFLNAASELDDAIISGGDGKRLEDANQIFWKSRRDLNSKLAIETPRIRQAMPLGSGAFFELSSSLMVVGAAIISDCFRSGKVVDMESSGVHRKRLECLNNQNLLSVKYADERILKVQTCVSQFYYAIRPNPSNDLKPEKIINNIKQASNNVGSVCNGVTMLGLSYDKTYGKYISPYKSALPE